ncbi:MAG: hypothetical protein IPO31_15065 [Candidatus Obscuribacter sp.]|nr:hypothetical protein [Candidatus Obscuribacter sp.]
MTQQNTCAGAKRGCKPNVSRKNTASHCSRQFSRPTTMPSSRTATNWLRTCCPTAGATGRREGAASTQMAAAQRQIKPANGPQLLSQPEADAWQIAMEAIGATYEEARRAAEQIYEEARASHSAQFEVTTREISEDFLKRKGQIVNDLHAKLRLIDQEHERDLTTLAVQYQGASQSNRSRSYQIPNQAARCLASYVESRDNLVKVLSGGQ